MQLIRSGVRALADEKDYRGFQRSSDQSPLHSRAPKGGYGSL
jgi:hypothetical protein